jgi:hypothetical protein
VAAVEPKLPKDDDVLMAVSNGFALKCLGCGGINAYWVCIFFVNGECEWRVSAMIEKKYEYKGCCCVGWRESRLVLAFAKKVISTGPSTSKITCSKHKQTINTTNTTYNIYQALFAWACYLMSSAYILLNFCISSSSSSSSSPVSSSFILSSP